MKNIRSTGALSGHPVQLFYMADIQTFFFLSIINLSMPSGFCRKITIYFTEARCEGRSLIPGIKVRLVADPYRAKPCQSLLTLLADYLCNCGRKHDKALLEQKWTYIPQSREKNTGDTVVTEET